MLGPDGGRLAKRDGAVTLADQADLGRGPDQVLALLAASLGPAVEDPDPAGRLDPTSLLASFDLAELPAESWVLSPDVVAR